MTVARRVILGLLSLLSITAAAVWVRSYFVSDLIFSRSYQLDRTPPRLVQFSAGSGRGGIQFMRVGGELSSASEIGSAGQEGWCWMRLSAFDSYGDPEMEFFFPQLPWQRLGFTWEAQHYTAPVVGAAWLLIIPYYPLVMGFGVVPSVFVGRFARRYFRRRRGRCPTCGYDLRASTDRCAECGTVINR